MSTELSPEEQAFFETGGAQLPPGEVAASQDEPEPEVVEAAPVVEEAQPAAQQSPLIDASGLESLLVTRLQEMEQRIAELAAPKPSPKEEVVPDAETDPIGHMMYQLSKVNSQVAELQTKLTQEQQNANLKREFEQFTTHVRAIRDEFTKTTPDFPAAYEYIRNLRSADLVAMGTPRTEVQRALLQDELRLAQSALQHNKNPAAEMYEMAKRYGYKATAAAKPAETPDQKVTRLSNGQFASKAPARAAAPTADLTLEGLSEASNADLNNIVQDPNAWAKIVGGKPGGNDIFH
jgi:hypothetical protein